MNKYGILVTLAIQMALFGVIPGFLVWGVQMLWIPFWAAGVINGIGHFWGYRNFETEDAARNITRFGLWIGGEELHNNHHAYPTSAKFSMRWYEFDLGWLYLKGLSALGLAKVRRAPPKVKFDPSKWEVDAATLQAVIAHRYDVLARYARHMKASSKEEVARLRERGFLANGRAAKSVSHYLHRDADEVPAEHRETLDRALESSPTLKTSWTMRQELAKIWARSTLTTEQLTAQLKDWCERAEKSNVEPLIAFSRRLRSYA
jgi:stearoyl-CoA desaturase (delta-9 desaturase)